MDWRLRECNYGELNGAPVEKIEPRERHIDEPYPGGESWRQAVERLREFLEDVLPEFEGRRILVIAHGAQRYGLEHLLGGCDLEEVVTAPFDWREGWEYSAPLSIAGAG